MMPESAPHIERIPSSIEGRLAEVLAERRVRSRVFPRQYEQLWESVERMAQRGKKIRPQLLLDTYRALGGDRHRIAVDAACAIELLHLALVVHDDVIDGDHHRRGEMNIAGAFAWDATMRGVSEHAANAWGDSTALLAGDLVLTLAHSLLARLDLPQSQRETVLTLFEDTVFESVAGEQHDVWLSLQIEDTDPSEVVTMAEQKTAAYSFAAPLRLAAVLAGVDATVADELSVIGRQIGVIYQLRDDVLGVFGDPNQTGKSTLSDLREGKQTLLIAYARADEAWPGVAPLFGDSRLSTSDAQRLRDVVENSGARLFVESLIDEHCERAFGLIEEATISSALKDQLTALATRSSSRVS